MSKKVSKELPKEVRKIGLRLRQVRKELGFSNSDDFAYKYELNRSQYGKYEAGSEDLRISSLINILNKIDMSLNDFFNKDFDSL